MRLFIAIDIPEHARQQLEALQDSSLGVRWTSPGTMHLTLRFIGDVNETSTKKQLEEALEKVKAPAFDMTIKGLGYFPPRRQPKIIWAGIKENSALMELQEAVEQACRTVGFEPETRQYTPHITLGRVNGISKREVNAFFNQHKKLRIPDIPVNDFILYESKLSSDGAEHTPLEHFRLVEY